MNGCANCDALRRELAEARGLLDKWVTETCRECGSVFPICQEHQDCGTPFDARDWLAAHPAGEEE